MRIALLIAGVLATLLGTWWILQGTGVVPIGFMANQTMWAQIGAGVLVLGVILIVVSRRVGRRS